MTEYLTDLAKL